MEILGERAFQRRGRRSRAAHARTAAAASSISRRVSLSLPPPPPPPPPPAFGAFTFTMSCALLEPPGPSQERLNVDWLVSAAVLSLPEAAFAPVHAPEAVHA